MAPVAGLFISHIQSTLTLSHLVRLQAETQGLVDWRFLYASGVTGTPVVDFSYQPAQRSMPLRSAIFDRAQCLLRF
jgi:hypothetical protein